MASTGWIYSEHYMWKMTNFLGKGATAKVYQGVNQRTGEPVAVKCFTRPDRQWLNNLELQKLKEMEEKQMKELDLLGKLDHENVIKLLAIETEIRSKEKVAVMELCQGKSLFNILCDPENAYGMNEEEFLLVLSHSTAGLKYLREKDISHRDIKPGNIVLYITEGGRHVYKLADFGAARVILEDEYFESLYGTEEYLYPDLYEKALINQSVKKGFTPTVDLWSMGCTIYHAATGSLPFQPYRRRDRQAMYYILSNKPNDVISAIQDKNGHVEWGRELPKNCLLSRSLQGIMTGLLKKLLTKEVTISFKDFFIEVENILLKKRVHVFDVQYCTEHILYVDSNTTLTCLRVEIEKQTGMTVDKQILFHKGVFLDDLDPSCLICDVIEETSRTKPLILLSLSQMGFMLTPEQSHNVQVKFNKFKTNAKIEDDVHVAETYVSDAYVLDRHVEHLARCYNLLLDIPAVVMLVLKKKLGQLSQTLQQIVERLTVEERTLTACNKHTSSVMEFVSLLGMQADLDVNELSQIIQKRKDSLHSIFQMLFNVRKETNNLMTKHGLEQHSLKSNFWPGAKRYHKLTHSKDEAETRVQTIRASWITLDTFMKRLPVRSLDPRDYELEKTIIKQTGEKLLHLNQKCTSALQSVIRDLDTWYSEFQPDLVKCDCLKLEVERVVAEVRTFETEVRTSVEECERTISYVTSKAKTYKDEQQKYFQHISKGLRPDEKLKTARTKVFQGLTGVKDSQQNIRSAIEENVSLLKNFQTFCDQHSRHSNNSLEIKSEE